MTRTLTQHRLQDFTKHDWQVVSDENLDAIWPYLELKTTQFPGGEYLFARPIAGQRNHLIWGGSYSRENYTINGVRIEDAIENKLSAVNGEILLANLSIPNPIVIRTCKFDFAVWSDFVEANAYDQQMAIVAPTAGISFFFDEELEYVLYSRVETEHPDPFPGITDQDLAEAFVADSAAHRRHGDRGRLPFLQEELLPDTEERQFAELVSTWIAELEAQ